MKTVEESWRDDTEPNAKKLRDKKARQLRKEGYIVEIKTWDFTDLGRCKLYTLEANKK